MKRFFNPALNPTGLLALVSALYSLGTGIWNVAHGQQAVDPQVIVSALTAFASTVSHMMVTPVKDPKDGNGNPLVPTPVPPAGGTAS